LHNVVEIIVQEMNCSFGCVSYVLELQIATRVDQLTVRHVLAHYF